MFIELTSMADNQRFWLNSGHIVHIEQGPNEADTIIQTATDEYHVSERVEYVIDILAAQCGAARWNYPEWSDRRASKAVSF